MRHSAATREWNGYCLVAVFEAAITHRSIPIDHIR